MLNKNKPDSLVSSSNPLWQKRLVLITPLIILVGLLIMGLLVGFMQSLGWIPALQSQEISWQYYEEIFNDARFIEGLMFSVFTSFVSATLSVILGLIVCYLALQIEEKQQRQLLWLMQVPIIVPHIIVSIFIIQLFARTGLLARISYHLGMTDAMQFWSKFVFHKNGLGIILAYLWKGCPFVVFTCLPLMLKLSDRLGQASSTLGASFYQSFKYVILPLCHKTILLSHLILFLFAFGAYDLPKLLGPTFPKALPILAYEAYIHPDLLNRPRAMAMNGVIFLLAFLILLSYGLLLNLLKGNTEGSDEN